MDLAKWVRRNGSVDLSRMTKGGVFMAFRGRFRSQELDGLNPLMVAPRDSRKLLSCRLCPTPNGGRPVFDLDFFE